MKKEPREAPFLFSINGGFPVTALTQELYLTFREGATLSLRKNQLPEITVNP
jgi:hypothetical protein